MKNYLDATPESGKNFFLTFQQQGKVVMLNLLKYRSKADYTHAKELDPGEELTGREAYQLYMKHTRPVLEQAGSKVLFYGDCGHFLIGPDNEKWDTMLLVEHESAEKFIAFAQNPDYLKTAGHRKAALEDSRLLPITLEAFER